ncbi:hypothetical protein GEV33_011381 [Tenebrio molitor]|uniref:Uncharacterized protein n=1 Tax=Tenebrio molitor TaxID=7067 RepID=A0A8J6HAX1_TENMO|nr:hypothetical protein GEV33_011381 [Tenebrio molitor]
MRLFYVEKIPMKYGSRIRGGRKSTLAVVEDAADDRSNPGVFTLHFLRAMANSFISYCVEFSFGESRILVRGEVSLRDEDLDASRYPERQSNRKFIQQSVERMSLKSGYHGRKNLRPSPSSSNMASIMSGRLVTSDLNKSRVAGELAAAVLFRSWAKGRRSRGGVGGICCPRMVKFAKRRARGGHQLFFDGNKRANREVDFPIF